MPIQQFKRVLRARLARAAELKPGPFGPSGVNAARQIGDEWRTTGSDPHILFPAPGDVAALVVFLKGERDGALTPRLVFNWSGGFSEHESVGFEGVRAAL